MFDQDGDAASTPGSPNPNPTSNNSSSTNSPQTPIPPVVSSTPSPVTNNPMNYSTEPKPADPPSSSLPSWAQPSTIRSEAPAPATAPTAEPPTPEPKEDQIEKIEPVEEKPPLVSAPVEPPKESPLPSVEPETKPAPVISDPEENLEQASSEVANLYLDYRLKTALAQEADTAAWEAAAKKNPLYAQRINDFSAALREAEKVKKESYPEADALMQKINFHQVENEASRMLLTDLLWRRGTTNGGKLDRELNFPDEATQMLKEMGITDTNEDVEMSPAEIMEKILSGKLRVIRLPKS